MENNFQTLPISALIPSPYNPRKHFDDAKLAELAASIKEKGVLEPILVRPIEALRGGEYKADRQYYEIVAGERRFRAAKTAGLTEIPTIVRQLSDGEAAEIAIVENAQRADLTPVEEARGFKMLIDQFGYTVEDAALKMGLSAKTVAQRLRLLVLPEKALKALDEGLLPLGSAVHLSRLADEKLRAQAAKLVLQGDWRTNGKALSPGDTLSLIRRRFMTELSAAGFPTADANLLPGVGACTACPHRSGAQADLFDELGKKDLCLNTACFARKKEAHRDRVLAEAQQQGLKVLSEKEAKQVWRYTPGVVTHDAAYVEAKDKFAGDAGNKKRSYEKIIGKRVEPVIAVDDANVVHRLYPKEAVKKALADLGFKSANSKLTTRNQSSDEDKLRQMREKADDQGLIEALRLMRRTARQFVPKFATPAQRSIFRAIVHGYFRGQWGDDMKVLAKALELSPAQDNQSAAIAAIKNWLQEAGDEDAYISMLMLSVIRNERAYEEADRKPSMIVLDELGIDLKALRAEALAALKEKAKQVAAKKAAKLSKAKGGSRGK